MSGRLVRNVRPTTVHGLAVLGHVSTNAHNQAAGPFLNTVPAPPGGGNPAWQGAYVYLPRSARSLRHLRDGRRLRRPQRDRLVGLP
jgi:hypothetical protein